MLSFLVFVDFYSLKLADVYFILWLGIYIYPYIKRTTNVSYSFPHTTLDARSSEMNIYT